MGLKSFNPYTASRRFMTVLDKSEITKETPEKARSSRKSARAAATTTAKSSSGIAAAATRSNTARSISGATKTASRPRLRRSNTTRTAAPTSRCCTTRMAKSATFCIRWGWKSARRSDRRRRGHSSRQCAEVPAHSAGHHGAQPGALSRHGRPSWFAPRAVRRSF